MKSKLAIFIMIGALLAMAVYSASLNYVSAKVTTSCQGTGKTTSHCTVFDDANPDLYTSWDCKYNTQTKKWSCVEVPVTKDSQIPTELKTAVDAAVQQSQESNTGDSKDTSDLKNNSVPEASPDTD